MSFRPSLRVRSPTVRKVPSSWLALADGRSLTPTQKSIALFDSLRHSSSQMEELHESAPVEQTKRKSAASIWMKSAVRTAASDFIQIDAADFLVAAVFDHCNLLWRLRWLLSHQVGAPDLGQYARGSFSATLSVAAANHA